MSSCTILMRMKSSTGESCYFKDDSGRFSSDINKTHTLKVKVKTAYKLTFECPKHMRIISVSMDGAPVQMEDAPGQRPDADKVLCVGVWRTDVHFATEVSKRIRIETVLVLQVDGLKGPDSDERHLLKTKLLVKFYDPAYGKYTEKGHALGAVRFRCQIGGESGGSKVTAVTFADALHVEALRRDEHGDDHVHVTPSSNQKNNTKPITISEKEDKVVDDDDDDILGDGPAKKPTEAAAKTEGARSTSPVREKSGGELKAGVKPVSDSPKGAASPIAAKKT